MAVIIIYNVVYFLSRTVIFENSASTKALRLLFMDNHSEGRCSEAKRQNLSNARGLDRNGLREIARNIKCGDCLDC